MSYSPVLLAFCVCVSTASAADFPAFKAVEIDPRAGDVCYAVTLADVDGDGRDDVVVATENRVLWYQNPTWKKRVIIEGQTERDNVCIMGHDIDGDGKVDFALGAGWTKIGTIQWLSRGASLDEKWQVHMIGKIPWTHRMRFADVLGDGRAQLTVSPLNATSGSGVEFTAFQIPEDPKRDRWPAVILDSSLNRMHNHWHLDWDGDGTVDTLAASQEGVHLVTRFGDGWRKVQLGQGAPGENPQDRGAGEVKVGKLAGGARFIATIEPMHGNSVAVYTEPAAGDVLWKRQVLDDTLKQGHAVWTADLDGDGGDELIAGHREAGTGQVKGPGLSIYRAGKDATSWTKHVLDDGGIAVEDAVAGDLNGDGRIDIVGCGRATHNVMLYINEGTPEEN